VEENDAKVLVFSRALREKKEPRVKSLSLIKMGNNTPTPITFDDDEERRCCETHAQQRDDNKRERDVPQLRRALRDFARKQT